MNLERWGDSPIAFHCARNISIDITVRLPRTCRRDENKNYFANFLAISVLSYFFVISPSAPLEPSFLQRATLQ